MWKGRRPYTTHGKLACIQYWHPKWGKPGKIYYYSLSDCGNHSSLAGRFTEEAAMENILRTNPVFKVLWGVAKEVVDFYDQGLHFDSYEFLGYKLVTEQCVSRK